MTYTELSRMSAGWGFTLGSIAGDMVNTARWGYTKAAFKKAKVTEREIETLRFWAAKEGRELPVALDVAFAGLLK
jgi:hypothetical protein